MFALPSPRGLQQLLGYWDQEGDRMVWHVGRAQLTAYEAEALGYLLGYRPAGDEDEEAQQLWEIRELMDRRRGDDLPLALDTVRRYIRKARRKLRLLFGISDGIPNKYLSNPGMMSSWGK